MARKNKSFVFPLQKQRQYHVKVTLFSFWCCGCVSSTQNMASFHFLRMAYAPERSVRNSNHARTHARTHAQACTHTHAHTIIHAPACTPERALGTFYFFSKIYVPYFSTDHVQPPLVLRLLCRMRLRRSDVRANLTSPSFSLACVILHAGWMCVTERRYNLRDRSTFTNA